MPRKKNIPYTKSPDRVYAEATQSKPSISLFEIIDKFKEADGTDLLEKLPNPSPVLQRYGKEEEAYRNVLANYQVMTCYQARKIKTQSKEYRIEPGEASQQQIDAVTEWLRDVGVKHLIDLALNIPFWGRQYFAYDIDTEGSLWIPHNIKALPVDNFIYDNSGKLKVLTAEATEEGIFVTPEHQILDFVHEPTYSPYGLSLLGACLWETLYIKEGKNFYLRFVEKYGMPWPVGTYDIQKLINSFGIDASDLSVAANTAVTKFTDLLNNMIQDAVFVAPEGVELDVKSTGTTANSDIYLSNIKHSEANISKIILGHSSAVDSTSNKLGSESTAMYVRDDIGESDRQIAQNVINKFIQLFVKMNYGDAPAPKLILFEEDDIDTFKQRAERDNLLFNIGWRPSKEYLMKTQNLAEDDFELVNTTSTVANNATVQNQNPQHQFFNLANDNQIFNAEDEYPDQTAIDEFIEFIKGQKTNKDLIDNILKQLDTAIDDADYIDEILDKYAEIYGDIDTEKFMGLLVSALFITWLHGEHSIQIENGDNDADNFDSGVLKFVLDKTPEKIVEYLESKGLKLSSNWEESLENVKQHAFTVAGVSKMEILKDFKDAVIDAVEQGKTLKEFKDELRDVMKTKGWYDPKLLSNYRLDLIYRTNVQSAYMDSRNNYAITNTNIRPYVRFISTLDKSTSSNCKKLHNVIMDLRDKDIKYFLPMGHFNCRRRYVTLTEAKIGNSKVTAPKSVWNYKNAPGFERLPDEQWKPDMRKYPEELKIQFEKDNG